VRGLTAFSREHAVSAAQITAIGAFKRVTLGFFDPGPLDFKRFTLDEQLEVLSLIGDVAEKDGEPQIHAHVVVGCSDGSTRGGHLFEGIVWPTLEVIVTEAPAHLRKRVDDETGLALIDL
jgi:predicted DNA-binding protein with PD1-like motif